MLHAPIGRGESVQHFETMSVRKESKNIDLSATTSPIRDRSGAIVGASNIGRDIADRERAEQTVKESPATSQAALEEIADQQFALDQHAMVAVADAQGTITYVNDKFCAISQYSKDELVGQNHRILNSRHHPPEFFQEIYRTIANGKVWRNEIKNRTKDGSIYWVDTAILPCMNEEGKPRKYMAVGVDITDRKRAEEALQQRTVELEAAHQELETFTYSVSHDLRAPLRHISAFSKILAEEYSTQMPGEAQRYLQRVQDGIQRMGLLVDDLLNLARVGRQELRRQVTGLNSVVREVVRDLQPECEGRQVEWRVGSLPLVECDPDLMKQVFQHLLSNALKYTRPRSSALIEVGTQDSGGQTIVFVRDNGVGFSMKYADKLFGVFQRLHRAEDFEGTGVGLATVQRVIHKHGGRVWAEAELDNGAVFYFTIGGRSNDATD
jgi:PAS domain S-box-containing protein